MNGSAYYWYWLTRNLQFEWTDLLITDIGWPGIHSLSGKGQGFTDKLFRMNKLSGRRRGFTDESRNKNKVPCAEWADLLITDIGWPGIHSLSVKRQGFTDKLLKINNLYYTEKGWLIKTS